MEWISPLLDVDIGEALGLLSVLQWVWDLHLFNRDFEMVSKTVVSSDLHIQTSYYTQQRTCSLTNLLTCFCRIVPHFAISMFQ